MKINSDMIVVAHNPVPGKVIAHFKDVIAKTATHMYKRTVEKKHRSGSSKALTEYDGRYYSILFRLETPGLIISDIMVLEMDQNTWLDAINKEKRDSLGQENRETGWITVEGKDD